LQPDQCIKAYIYGLENRWLNVERKNLDGDSPNDIVKKAAVQLGYLSEEEELTLYDEKAKKLHQLSRSISRSSSV
jgi:hypothetical protein